MYTHYLTRTCSLLAFLGSTTASPYDRDTSHEKVPPTDTATAAAASCTNTVVVTETLVLDKSLMSTYVLPSADASLTCPNPSEACIIDGIAIWPSSTTDTADPTSSLDPVASTTSPKSAQPTATMPSPVPTHNTTTSACPNRPSTLTTSLLPQTPPSRTGLHIFQFSMNTPAPTTASSKPQNVNTSSFDPVAWAEHIPHPHAKRSSNNAQPRSKPHFSFFFVAAHPQVHTKHQQIVRDEDEDEEYHRLKNQASEFKNQACVICEKRRSLVCINGTHYGYCDEGCAEPRKLRDGMKCVDGRIYGVRIYGVRGWRERMEG
jgi:hypothetical protein